MGRLKQKGKAGAAKAYVTRTAAVKKLQCSLADFRRLCILKGIFPREPRSRKKANKGSSAPTSFYYAKDIAYLAHEPVLKKLREHKAFAKKLSRALGRGEWSSAKSLEKNKPVYRLDHIIKERYPTFIDAVRDIDDALCMVFLFASLPSNSRVPPELIENCTRLSAEWQLYVMHSRSLRKAFLSIKGVYYQAEVMEQNVTWLIPYQFTQNIPTDVDVRVMLTFLELYQTLLGFVFFKLYTDSGLVYPPPLDLKKEEGGAGVGAFSLQDTVKTRATSVSTKTKIVEINGRTISSKDVRQAIKTINAASTVLDEDIKMSDANVEEIDEDFVVQPSNSDQQISASLPTLKSLTDLPSSLSTTLFAPYTFWLSRETSRPIFEFLVRSFGGRIGWPASSGSGSPIEESDELITHVIIDRPLFARADETSEERERRLRRKYVQPQWVVDCINAGKILLEEPYGQGKTLPPHLSPFGEAQGAYDPTLGLVDEGEVVEDSEDEELQGEEQEEVEDRDKAALKIAAQAAASTDDPAALRAAELVAEAAGVDFGTFEKEVNKSRKASKKKALDDTVEDAEKDMNKMMMSNKQKKLYEKMKYSQKKRDGETTIFMVGRSAKLAKQSPPSLHKSPPYDRPHILSETTTTRTEVVTTTTTTTHFFSFPLWKKRNPASSSPSRQSPVDLQSGADEHGVLSSSARSSFYMVDKDLPPIPSDEPALSASQHPGPSNSVDSILRKEALRSAPAARPPDSVRSVPSKRFTSALAQASLEVGLSPILPRTSSFSSSHEINTVAFTQSMSPLRPLSTKPRLRKSKSAQKLGATVSLDAATFEEYRRSRGISFNGSNVLSIGTDNAKVRDQERKDCLDRPSTISPFQFTHKGLARKTSFWSRRKPRSQDEQVDSLIVKQAPTSQSTQLPVLPPISPFSMNITIASPSNSTVAKQRSAHTPGLSRSHSAHSSLRRKGSEIERASSSPHHLTRPERAATPSVPSIPLTRRSSARPMHEPVVDEENATKRRPRAQTNPPLLNRLSLGWFQSSSPSMPSLPRLSSASSIFTRPHTSHSTLVSASKGCHTTFPAPTESPSSSHSIGLLVEKRPSVAIPLPTGDEEPFQYLRRLRATVSKAEVAGILASSSEVFYSQALRTYIGEFDFVEDPLDVALRKLLMDVGLPRETQQIDRVIEAFAKRYLECNPSLFSSDDHPYILAFSLIMLHTDTFNKSNKWKMSKADYIKNTRLPGIFPEVLTCFYDNIVFAPFIFIEDPLDFNGQRGIDHQSSSHSISTSMNLMTTPPTPISKASKIDPYYLIANNLLGPLRVDVDTLIPRENPYSYEGTAGPWDEAQLQRSFAMANQIEVSAADAGRASPFFSKGTIGGFAGPSGNDRMINPPISAGEIWSLKLTKVGLLTRKDDVLEGGKKATNRKWKTWSVVLTGSQLLFFRDLLLAHTLLSSSPGTQKINPQSALLRPDELLSVRGTIAVYDKSYNRHENTFRFLLPDGRQLLLQASSEKELNEWIAGINYASAFKTAGVRMRSLEMSKTDVQLTGVAAATSHLHDLQARSTKSHTWNDDTPRDPTTNDAILVEPPFFQRKLSLGTNIEDVDVDVPTAPEIDGAEQFKATFDQVKADLAAEFMVSNSQEISSGNPGFDLSSPTASLPHDGTSRLPSRTSIIKSKIDDLNSRITAAQAELDIKMRFARNIATLTPFQKSTRDQLLVSVQGVAQRVVQARFEIVRLVCHRDILANDIASEWNSWHRAKTIALQAAMETLQNRHELAPRTILSRPTSDAIDICVNPEDPVFLRPCDSSPSRRSESSICESFYSAMDFGPDWPSSSEASLKFLCASHLFDSAPPSASSSFHSHATHDGNLEPPRRSSTSLSSLSFQDPRGSGELLSHDKFYAAPETPEEEAEDWNQTRCAQRVSLNDNLGWIIGTVAE
ncbi:hypothetical protein C0993_007026 [Termitomyces sp. T159_Od127]|nr:hypothetical protein C0993_007026 [Termitomyces sp. T159_Od127]